MLILSPLIDINKFCGEKGSRYEEHENYYEMNDSLFEEHLLIDKETREIRHYGFNGYIADMIQQKIFVETSYATTQSLYRFANNEDNKDIITLPQTIGNITFRSKKELFDWIIRQQNYNK